MATRTLSPEQEAEAQRLTNLILDRTRDELLEMNRMLVAGSDRELLGSSEFSLRDHSHAIGARLLETALTERKKGGNAGRA